MSEVVYKVTEPVSQQHRVKYEELPWAVREVIDELKHDVHRSGKQLGDQVRERYADLVDVVGESFEKGGYTHFHVSAGGDLVFTNNANRYGQAFKRLWNVHLPLH